MSHSPKLRLVENTSRPVPPAAPVGRSFLHAASTTISSTDRAVLTEPPSGSRSQIGPAAACPKEGGRSCERQRGASLLGKRHLRRNGMREPSVRCVQRLQRNIIIPGRC